MTEDNSNANDQGNQNQDADANADVNANANNDANANANANANAADNKDDKGTLLGEAGATVEAPENYEFKAPEGMELDTGLIEKVTPVLKELDLSQDKAQKLVDAYAPYVKEQVATREKEAVDAWGKQVDEWKTETVKQLGTTAKEDLAAVGKILNAAGTPELRKILDDSGYGNHPEFVKFFVKIGKSISEDTFVESTPSSDTSGKDVDLDKIYPTMKGK